MRRVDKKRKNRAKGRKYFDNKMERILSPRDKRKKIRYGVRVRTVVIKLVVGKNLGRIFLVLGS